jgi:hypothetical protein
VNQKVKANFAGPEVVITNDTYIYVGGDCIGTVEQTQDGTRVTLRGGKKIRMPQNRYTLCDKFSVEKIPGFEQFKADLLNVLKRSK